MPKYRADFDVKGSLVLTAGAGPILIYGNDPSFEMIFSNTHPTEAQMPKINISIKTTFAAPNEPKKSG